MDQYISETETFGDVSWELWKRFMCKIGIVKTAGTIVPALLFPCHRAILYAISHDKYRRKLDEKSIRWFISHVRERPREFWRFVIQSAINTEEKEYALDAVVNLYPEIFMDEYDIVGELFKCGRDETLINYMRKTNPYYFQYNLGLSIGQNRMNCMLQIYDEKLYGNKIDDTEYSGDIGSLITALEQLRVVKRCKK